MSKKLLSVLVVLALALSMIPMVGLPATEAEAATFNNANLKDANKSTAGMQAVCPHCAANGDSAGKTWTALSKNSVIGNVAAGEHHYYMAEDVNVTSTSRYLEGTNGTKICLHLNGKNLSYGNVMMVATGTTLNVMGNGNVTYLGLGAGGAGVKCGMYLNGNATANSIVNIYGGTWKLGTGVTDLGVYIGRGDLTISGTAKFESEIQVPNAAHANDAPAAHVILKEKATTDKLAVTGGKLTVDASWTGTATVIKDPTQLATWVATGKYTGTLALETVVNGVLTKRGRYVTSDGATIMIGRATIGETWYGTLGAAVTAYTAQNFTDGVVIKSYCAAGSSLPTVAGQSYYIDLNGFNATKVGGAGTVYLLDSANDTYDATKCGQATIEDGSTVTIKDDVTVGGKRYLTLKDATSGAHTAHLLTIDITDAVLRTSENGLLFKAKIGADEVLGAMIKSCGVVVSNTDAPTAVVEAHNAFTKLDFTPNSKGIVYTNSALVKNIFKDAADATNKTRSETKIYAKAYVTLQKDATSEPVEMFGEGVSASAADVLKAIDTKWSSYNAKAQANAKSFFAQWKGKGASGNRIEDLGLTNIK